MMIKFIFDFFKHFLKKVIKITSNLSEMKHPTKRQKPLNAFVVV